MSKVGINRVVCGAKIEKARHITNISTIQGRKIVITKLSGTSCSECQKQ